VEACQLGYEAKLPTRAPRDHEYLGLTNLPGLWLLDAFLPAFGLRAWRNTLFALRALAQVQSKPGDKPIRQSSEQPARPTDIEKAVPIDKLSLALAMLRKHPDWSARRIAKEVGCSASYLSQQPVWQAAVKAIKGLGQEGRQRSGRHRGHDMDQYQESNEHLPAKMASLTPECECGDPAEEDSAGRPLVYEGKPRCRECWAELQKGR
jgi:hypothetical protein